jgi:undecaprenyl-diphosphatase
LLATLVAFLVGYVVVIAFMRLISSVSFKGFAYYRIGLGCVLLLLLLTGLVKAV